MLNVSVQEFKEFVDEVIYETLSISKKDHERFMTSLIERLREEDPSWGEDEDLDNDSNEEDDD